MRAVITQYISLITQAILCGEGYAAATRVEMALTKDSIFNEVIFSLDNGVSWHKMVEIIESELHVLQDEIDERFKEVQRYRDTRKYGTTSREMELSLRAQQMVDAEISALVSWRDNLGAQHRKFVVEIGREAMSQKRA